MVDAVVAIEIVRLIADAFAAGSRAGLYEFQARPYRRRAKWPQRRPGAIQSSPFPSRWATRRFQNSGGR